VEPWTEAQTEGKGAETIKRISGRKSGPGRDVRDQAGETIERRNEGPQWGGNAKIKKSKGWACTGRTRGGRNLAQTNHTYGGHETDQPKLKQQKTAAVHGVGRKRKTKWSRRGGENTHKVRGQGNRTEKYGMKDETSKKRVGLSNV